VKNILVPFGLGNQVELRHREAFPHLTSHYAVLKYHNAWGNLLDSVPMESFTEIKKRAFEGAGDYLYQNAQGVLTSLRDERRFTYLHPGSEETLTLNTGSEMEILFKKIIKKAEGQPSAFKLKT